MKILETTSAVINHFSRITCSIALFAMMVLTFVDVVARYALKAPIYGSFEIVSILLAISVFSGLCVATRTDSHIAVEILNYGPGITGKFMRVAIRIGSIAALGLIAYVLIHHAATDLRRGTQMLVLGFNRGLVLTILSVLTVLALIAEFINFAAVRPHRDNEVAS